MKFSMQSNNPASLLRVLVVSAHVERAMATRHVMRDWPLNAQIEWVCTRREAMRRASEWPAALAIVDCADESFDGAAVVRQLRGREQQLDVLAFGDATEPCEGAPPVDGVSPWTALAQVLDEWRAVQHKPQTTPA